MARRIANVSLWSSRHAKAVVAVALALTVVSGYGMTLITTNVDVADVLPRGNPNTAAAQNLTDQFKSTFTQQVTFQIHVDPANWAEDNARLPYRGQALLGVQESPGAPTGPHQMQPNPHNITDEVYVRAMDEMIAFVQREAPEFQRQISISNIYSLINWTRAGGERQEDEASFSLPGHRTPQDAQQYAVVDQAVKAAILDTVDAISSPSWNHAAVLFMPAADSTAAQAELGRSVMRARDAYVAAVDACIAEGGPKGTEPCSNGIAWTVFGSTNPPLLTVDLPVANAHSSELVERDLVYLMPIIAGFIILCLFIAFRNVRAIAISFASLVVGVIWTYGAMGYMGIALNTLNMTIVPLIMGVGIDYAIHMINEFVEHKSHGHSDAAAFEEAGNRAGLAMFIATLTTVLGLIVMMVSPSLLMAQLGLLSAIAIAATYILTITFIPAALTLVGGSDAMGQSFTPSRLMPGMARGVTRIRVVALLLVAAFSGMAWSGLPGTDYNGAQGIQEEAFGDPGKNFPADDPVRQEHEQGLRYFYEMEDPDVKANILTFEGPGILSPASVAYMREIEKNLRTQDRVIEDTLRTLPFFVETWLTVKGGAPGAATNTVGGNLPAEVRDLVDALDPVTREAGVSTRFPDTQEALRAEIDAMFNSPMRELSSIIINHPTALEDPSRGMAAMTFSVRAETYDQAAEVWGQVWHAVAQANATFGGQAPEGVHVAFVGNTATNYLFVAEQLPWLTYMSIAATIILFLLVLLFTGSLKATVVATLLASATSIWWLGILPLMDIGLAITLMLPLVFIFNIGTDYAVHIIWNLKQVPSAWAVFQTTGKAILFSAVTTAGAFAIFTFIRNVAVSRTMMATTLSIGVIFLATMLVIPVFYPVERGGAVPSRPERTAPAAPQLKARRRVKGGS